jgi:acyl carrier protein
MSSSPGGTNLDTASCQNALQEIFRDFFDDDTLTLRPDMTAHDVEGWDSLANIRLLLTIERKFQIKFSASEVGGLQNVEDLVALVARKAAYRGV